MSVYGLGCPLFSKLKIYKRPDLITYFLLWIIKINCLKPEIRAFEVSLFFEFVYVLFKEVSTQIFDSHVKYSMHIASHLPVK